jgi:hypothetical protein
MGVLSKIKKVFATAPLGNPKPDYLVQPDVIALPPAPTQPIPAPESLAATSPVKPDAEIIQEKVQEVSVLMELGKVNARKQQAYRRGQIAKSKSFMRVSPYYEDDGADRAWFAGYDGKIEPTLDAILVPFLENK